MNTSPASDYEIDQPFAAFGQSAARGDRLRIAFLVEATSAGVGRHVIDLASAMRELGHSVDLLYSMRRIDSRFSDGLELLASRGVATCEIDMRHSLHPADLVAIGKVRRYVHANGPFDILHCHSTKAGFVGRVAALGANSRKIYTPHALITMSPFQSAAYHNLAGWLERVLASLGDAVICVSENEYKHARELGLAASTLYTVPNGIDHCDAHRHRMHRSAMRAHFGLGDREVCIGFVGRLSQQKSPLLLLEAFALIPRDLVPPTRLLFIGSGPEVPILRKRINELGLQKDVLMIGELNGLQAMSAFDIFALPSTYEGLPYVLLEALSMGLPVVSTDVGGVATLVLEGINGFVTKKSVPAEMATALQKLLLDPDLRNRMGAASSEMTSQFSLVAMARQVEEVYRKLLA
jgi:glycosyltransferase involved in cell wall biosynthesis